MPEENGITYLRDTGIKCKPRILYSAKLTFNYKRHKTTGKKVGSGGLEISNRARNEAKNCTLTTFASAPVSSE